MSAETATGWFEFFLNVINQPLHVILLIIIAVQWYALIILGRRVIGLGLKFVRTRLLLAMAIEKADEITLDEAEDRAERMIDRGAFRRK